MSTFETSAVANLTKILVPSSIDKLSEANKKFEHFCKNKFIPYILRSYNVLDQSTSQLFRNRNYSVSKLYEPLDLHSLHSNVALTIDGYPYKLFENHKKIIINDDAGMGKSTILKMIFRYSVDSSAIIPFYIDLKSLVVKDNVLTIQEYISSTNPDFSDELSIKFLSEEFLKRPYLFLFDGADEVPDSVKDEVFSNVKAFKDNARNCLFVVATRNEDKILSAFNDFVSFNIEPMTEEQAFSLLRRYQFGHSSADSLIKEIQKEENSAVKEFLTNPLLTSLLYTAYEHTKTIPLKKSSFFSQIYRSLYENHDATKIGYLTRTKKSGLDIDDFSTVLSYLAFLGRRVEKLEYDEDELVEQLKLIQRTHPTIVFDARGFLVDITSRVPLFRLEGLKYRWQHKSIQEYFFLTYILGLEDKEDRHYAIKQLSQSEMAQKYKLVLDILYDKDSVIFHDVLTRNILKVIRNNAQPDAFPSLDDVANIFYKCFSGAVESVFTSECLERAITPHIEFEGLSSVDFDELYDDLYKHNNLKNYVPRSAMYRHSNPPHCTCLLSRPEAVVLDILHAKKHSFIVHEATGDPDEFTSPQRENNKPIALSLPLSRIIDDPLDFYIPDYEKLLKFMNDFDRKSKLKRQSSGFSLEGL
ncbi:MAG: NACHT domain-containing protein [Gammaproteobacteria bacterium]|nr:NACHT domain-containing protein [Gammaproteobacteria bacterium]